jgi:hypothetical protein
VSEFEATLPSAAATDNTPPPSLDLVSNLVRQELKRYFPASDCPTGTATIPEYSDSDPFLYVLADFGKCGRGILILKSSIEVKWRFSQFVMAPDDVEWFSERIRARRLSTLPVRP